jgi:ATP-dependent DNA ligase
MREKEFNMECYPYDFNRFKTWEYGIIQPKYDGDRVRMVIENSKAILLSSSKRIITSLPHLNNEFTEMYSRREGLQIDFEAYCHEMKHPEISGIVRTTKFVPEKSKLIKAYILDLPTSIGDFTDRLADLSSIQEENSIAKVPSYAVKTNEDVKKFLKVFCSQGYEGFVLKNPLSKYETKRSVNWLKYKPRKIDSYQIIGFVEEVDKFGEYKDTLGALILSCPKGTFNVGTGFDDETRKYIWTHKSEFLYKFYTISYQELSKDGIPREPSAKITDSLLED